MPVGALWCLTDGGLDFDADVFPDLGVDQIEARLTAAGDRSIRTDFNAFLYRDGDGVLTLIDAGCGTAFGPSAGGLGQCLVQLGVRPDDIARLVLTHTHGDHCGGALGPDGPVFGQAQVCLHPEEIAFARGSERTGGAFADMYGDRFNEVTEGQEIAPGLSVWAPQATGHLRGHTPGHIGVLVEGAVVVAGDVLHSEALQLCDPDLCPIYDEDAQDARVARWAVLSEIADRDLVFAGGHVLGPHKAARLRRAGDGFRKVPA